MLVAYRYMEGWTESTSSHQSKVDVTGLQYPCVGMVYGVENFIVSIMNRVLFACCGWCMFVVADGGRVRK